MTRIQNFIYKFEISDYLILLLNDYEIEQHTPLDPGL